MRSKYSFLFTKTLDFGASILLILYHQTSDKKLLIGTERKNDT